MSTALRTSCIGGALVVTLLCMTASTIRGQQARLSPNVPRGFGGATGVISPVVVAQWFASRTNRVEELELLVLWRGTPGWFLQPGGSGESGGALGTHYTWIKYGAVDLSLDFEESTRRVTIQGKNTIELGANNVLFVDEVDSEAGPRTVGLILVPRAMPGSAGQIAPILRSSPRIMSFLRCDAGSESPRRSILQPLCLQNVGVER